MADLNMQTVPLAAVVSDSEKIPEQELLPTTPDDAKIEEIRAETTGEERPKSGETNHVPAIPSEPSTKRLIIEATLMTIFGFLPCLLVWGSAEYEEYSLIERKGPAGLNSYHEFYRVTLFMVISYVALTLGPLVFRPLARILLWLCKQFDRPLGRQEALAIVCVRYAASYLGTALGFFIIYWMADLILYEPSRNMAAAQLFGMLPLEEQSKAQQMLLGDKIEKTLAAAFIFSMWMALEKYVVAAVRSSFHRVAIGPRAIQCNKKFEVLGVLYRARVSDRPTLSTATLTSGGNSAGNDIEDGRIGGLIEDQGLDLHSTARAKVIADGIFKSTCPADRSYLVVADFKAYFAVGEHEQAFRIFDPNRKGQLDKYDFRSAVNSIYEERFRLARAIVANNHIVVKLDWTLLVIFGLLGALFALVTYNHQGYNWVTSIGSFILGFSFLFRTTMTKVFDTFLFVFVEHAYDVSDSVLVDNEKLVVQEVEIFTTIFERVDGTIVYSPNANLKSKTIYNKQRAASEQDEIVALFNADTAMGKLTTIRSKLRDFLTETVNEFTGTVAVNIVTFMDQGAARKATVKVESKYRQRDECSQYGLTLPERRIKFLEKFRELCDNLGINYSILDHDK